MVEDLVGHNNCTLIVSPRLLSEGNETECGKSNSSEICDTCQSARSKIDVS